MPENGKQDMDVLFQRAKSNSKRIAEIQQEMSDEIRITNRLIKQVASSKSFKVVPVQK